MNIMKHLLLGLIAVTVVVGPRRVVAAPITEQAAHAIGVDAYLYFYPLITMDITRKQSTNIEAGEGVW